MCALNLPGFSVGSKKYTAVSTRPEDANLAGFSVPKENRVCTKPARFFCWEREIKSCFTVPEDANLAGFSVPNENRVCAKPTRFSCWGKKYTAVSTRPEDANLAGFSVPNENRVCAKPARFSCWEQEIHSCFNKTQGHKPDRFFTKTHLSFTFRLIIS
ncbi:hypothetical protein [Algoriphagus sp. AGSA1]|uniref:hypothetical protein n=1 Tax=Algoriphagus sp. AGSA1 TaxID=2907213 RepID=UPI001F3CDD59|nr:hypothetical protein [Algoriphagus sp. AGSA1]